VVAVQALLFQDGGLLAMGANVFNMAVVGVLVGWGVYRALKRLLGDSARGTMVSGFAAAWLSVVIASLVAAAELVVSGTSTWSVALPAMGLVHVLIGIGEGLITVGVLSFLGVVRPDLLSLHCWHWPWCSSHRWPRLTRMAWSGWRRTKASWIKPGMRRTRPSPTICSPASRMRLQRRS